MKRKRFKEEQIIRTLKRLESGENLQALSRELGIHQNTIYSWRSKYGGMELSELAELKSVKDENRRLKRAVAELTLDNQMLRDVTSRKW